MQPVTDRATRLQIHHRRVASTVVTLRRSQRSGDPVRPHGLSRQPGQGDGDGSPYGRGSVRLRPRTSRRPSADTPVAMTTAWEFQAWCGPTDDRSVEAIRTFLVPGRGLDRGARRPPLPIAHPFPGGPSPQVLAKASGRSKSVEQVAGSGWRVGGTCSAFSCGSTSKPSSSSPHALTGWAFRLTRAHRRNAPDDPDCGRGTTEATP
jgi:hypothetical protein